MATTQNTYTGDGSTTNYSFTFEYLKQADVKVTLDTVATTAYTFANATTLSFTTAPASGVAIRIFRDTDIDTLQATFFAGSAIKAEDLNNNFTQSNFAVQEADFNVDTANTTAASAVTTANSAVTTANGSVTTANSADTKADTAIATANTADTNASAAVATANTASTNATNAVNTANTASTNASNAVTTANSAATDAATAISTANSATTTANTATTAAQAAQTDANTATATANSATTTANSATTTANAATATANTADTNASAAVTTANAASATANAAQSAVAGAAFYSPVSNVANIPSSPSDQDRVEVADSTGIQSFSPLTGYPVGFTGASGLTARIQYSSSGSTWNWVDYFANDPEDRYFTKASGNTNAADIATNVTNIAANVTTLATKMPLAGGTFTGAVSFDDNVIVKGDSTNGSGELTINCENNSHGIKIKGPPHSAAATYTLTLPNNTGTSGQALKTDGNGTLSFADVSSSFITQTDFAYKPSSNQLTLSGPSVASLSGANITDQHYKITLLANNEMYVIWRATNTTANACFDQMVDGNAITIGYYYDNSGTPTYYEFTSTFDAFSDNTGSSPLEKYLSVDAVSGTNQPTPLTGSYPIVIKSPNLINGFDAIANNQVLRYKTATQKWTVDDAEVIAIVDGGNFTTGGSLVQTSTTYDGGSF